MKKIILLLALFSTVGLHQAYAQKAPAKKTTAKKPLTEEEKQKKFDEVFAEIFQFINSDASEADGKKSGMMDTVAEFGSYKPKAAKSLPYTVKEAYGYYSQWEYRAEFGKFKAGQEAQQQAMEEKITKLVKDNISKTDWKDVSSGKDDEKTKELLHYNKAGKHHIRLKVFKGITGNNIILTWD